MSGNRLERLEEFRSGVAEKIGSTTVPGKSNRDVIEGMRDGAEVVEAYLEDLNNWVVIVDARVRDDGSFGIPARYRWTIKRWAKNDMDGWLEEHGWNNLNHLKADERRRERHEMEARYMKELAGYEVYTNIWVPWTEDVFDRLQKRGSNFTPGNKEYGGEAAMEIMAGKREP